MKTGLKDKRHSNQIDADIVSTHFSRKSNHSDLIFAYHSCASSTGSIVPDGSSAREREAPARTADR
jgi:hypothetical protein